MKMETEKYRINLCKAIQSLDSLNDQIVQYIFSQSHVDIDLEKDLSPREQETLQSSMVLIRRLLVDAQSKFRKMVEDNKQLAARIDGSIQAANQEVNALRAELADTNKRLSQISSNEDKNEETSENDNNNKQDIESTGKQIIPSNKSEEDLELVKLKEVNLCLENEVKSLKEELAELQSSKKSSNNDVQTSNGELKLELIQLKQEFNRAKEALQAMKADRKRLKGEKLELLKQIKQLYETLEEKESELRDFIRNYEQRVQESDDTIKQLVAEKDESEREKWEIIKKARDSAERVVILRAQLDTKDQQIKKLNADIIEAKDNTVACTNKSVNLSDTNNTINSIDVSAPIEDLPPYESPPPSNTPNSFTISTSTPNTDRKDAITPLMKWFNSSHEYSDQDVKNKKKRKSFGSLSRVFTRGRTRRSIAMPTSESLDPAETGPCAKLILLSQDNYQEKLQILDQVKGVHMSTWKASHILAWLEISLSMPMYGKMCAENIKSGKVLLGLSDSELNAALNVVNILHRRKLRLAIEEQREPVEVRFPKSDCVDHTWVAHKWLPDLGLPQFSAIFDSHLIDGRTLNTLNKKDLEKYFDMHRKCHQASVLHGVELLRRLNFDKEVLVSKRSQCEETNTDPLVWSTKRIIKWIKSIDLGEYSENLKESGIHGALMVLEPSFTADTLATALGIPPSKSYIRRHLTSELESLIKPARAALDTPNNNSKKCDNGSANKSLNRSYRSTSSNEESRGRLSFRGSLSRAFGKKFKDDLKLAFDDTPKRKISAPIQIQHNSLDSVAEPTDSTPV